MECSERKNGNCNITIDIMDFEKNLIENFGLREQQGYMKKILSIFLCGALLIQLTGCNTSQVLSIEESIPNEFHPEEYDSYYDAIVDNMVIRTTHLYDAEELNPSSRQTTQIISNSGYDNYSGYCHFDSDDTELIFNNTFLDLGDEVFFDDAYIFAYQNRYQREDSLATKTDSYYIAVFRVIDESAANALLISYGERFEDNVANDSDADLYDIFHNSHVSGEDYECYLKHYSCSCGEYGDVERLLLYRDNCLIILYFHGGERASTSDFANSFSFYGFPEP